MTTPPHKGTRVEPLQTLYQGKAYKPSWQHIPRTTWTDRLGGHYGLVGSWLAAKQGAQ